MPGKHGDCPHCPKDRGVHDPECPNYFTGSSLVGVPPVPQPGSAPPPEDAEPDAPEGS